MNSPTLCLNARLCFAFLFCMSLSECQGEDNTQKEWQKVTTTLKTYCADCHGAETQEGDVRLDRLTLDLSDKRRHETLWSVLDQLEAGDMPPKDEAQPTDAQRSHVIEFLSAYLAKAEGKSISSSEPVPLRRLTRVQYRNTLRDLLGVDVTQDPTSSFPGDSAEHGFTTHAESLKVSSYLMDAYMQAADWALTAATRHGPRPETKKIQANYPDLSGPVAGVAEFADLYSSSTAARSLSKFKFLWRQFDRRYAPPPGGVKIGIEFEAEALNRKISDPEIREAYARQGYQAGSQPFALGIYLLTGSKETAKAQLVQAFDIPDHATTSHSLEVWIPDDYTIGFGFLNGPSVKKLHEFLPQLSGMKDSRKPDFKEAISGIDIPKIRIRNLILEGPIYEQWPPENHAAIYGEGLSYKEIVRQFAKRAFRRPVSEETIQPFVDLAGSDPQSLRRALIAVLCSPPFVYLQEPSGELDDYAIASRLSYFLWNSMPDSELLRLADKGQLKDPAVISAQLDRMLDDNKARSLTDEFVYQWLDFANISEMPPTGNEFRVFYQQNLHEAMLDETTRFFEELLDKNLPVRNFIDSDFTFLNRNLADLYGLDLDLGYALEKVSLTGVPTRGGLLGQGSVLTASANGVETSPVTRGVWVLENLMGTPPSPPPPNVPAASPDIRGALTVREILDKHRSDSACNSCHIEIDPHGYALEHFDPIGRWRESYPSGHAIEADGEIGRQAFDGIAEMKAVLLKYEKTVAKGLLVKLLEYGTGRKMELGDRAEIHRLTLAAQQRGYGLRDIFDLVATSPIFLSK
ncbi:MAG: DUF1592 domain-containing protein [Planctomycetaceae bacterium]|jgi:hypothetical protein|nr:DUF1592 domain-containing protein [Planctomycetaceae bacterium]